MKTYIVIPAFNEERVIRRVLEDVLREYEHVVVVDDASSDKTYDQARSTKAVVLRHMINRGQGAALKTGICYALEQGADTIVTFDSDGQHQVSDIGKLLAPLVTGKYDIILGSRFLQPSSQIPTTRRFVLQAGIVFTRLFSHIRVTDTHNGLRAMTADAARKIRIVQDRMAHASEILEEIMFHRLRYMEVPVTVLYSEYSKDKGQGNLGMFKIAFKFLMSKILH